MIDPTDTIGDDVRLYQGDCLAVLPAVLPTLAPVDAVVTDPPYGIVAEFGSVATCGSNRNGSRKLQFEWDGAGVADEVRRGLELAFKLCKPSAAVFVFTGFDQAAHYAAPAREAGFIVKPAAWVKECPAPAAPGNWWPSGFELAYYGYRKSPYFGDDDAKRVNVFYSDSYRHGQPGKVDHPTQKPLKMMRRLVRAVVPPGGVVLDCFMGSGTTGVAAIQEGRGFIGIEKHELYYRIALERLTHATGAGPGQLFGATVTATA